MNIGDFLQRLDHVSGPNASGEYMARCPCHDDKTASLSITVKRSKKDGKERIYFCDQSKSCTNQQIMDFLHITAKDLIVAPDQTGQQRKDPAPAGMTVRQAKPVPPATEKREKPPIDFAHPDKVYSYTDAQGRELFQVCRYQYTQDGKQEKTFRQRRYDPGNEKANREGWVASVPNELRDNTLYKMPQLLAAIQEKRPVYIVEGEKDVETLARLGHTATCNPGGAGKWRDGYTALLRGADVIILPDNDTAENDYTGQNHALNVALSLLNVAKRVRLVDIREACPDLPPKGDISDMVQIMGDVEAMDALARQVAATRDFDPSAVPFWLTPMQQAEQLYEQVQGYGVKDGSIVQYTQNGTKALTDFIVIPRMELTRDDGVNQSMDALTRARVLHAAEVDHANEPENLGKALEAALEENDLERAAQLARAKRDRMLQDVDAHGSIYRMELAEPSGNTFSAWLPVLKKLVGFSADQWAEYRRKLLDVPQQAGFPAVIEWPEKPTEAPRNE